MESTTLVTAASVASSLLESSQSLHRLAGFIDFVRIELIQQSTRRKLPRLAKYAQPFPAAKAASIRKPLQIMFLIVGICFAKGRSVASFVVVGGELVRLEAGGESASTTAWRNEEHNARARWICR